jgi:allantoate deiminase
MNDARVAARLEELFELGDPPHASRLGLTAAEEQGATVAAGWMREAGLDVGFDAVGNVIGRRPGSAPELPELWLGSHIDTVPAGGRYDGALGVVAAIEAATRLRDVEIERTFAVCGLRDEEGVRFGRSFLGSRALCGQLVAGELDTCDADGVSVGQALQALGRSPALVPGGGWLPPVAGWIEVHVEQGPTLADRDRAVGVVAAIAGVTELDVRFLGTRGHAGTVPMGTRADAFAAAAAFAVKLERAASSLPDAVATVGDVTLLSPGRNVIPGDVLLSVDLRAARPDVLETLEAAVADLASAAAESRGVRRELQLGYRSAPAPMDPELCRALRAHAEAAGVDAPLLPSGAGHDAAVFARAGVPSAMLFVRSGNRGISHDPAEHSDARDVAVAVDVLTATLATSAPCPARGHPERPQPADLPRRRRTRLVLARGVRALLLPAGRLAGRGRARATGRQRAAGPRSRRATAAHRCRTAAAAPQRAHRRRPRRS